MAEAAVVTQHRLAPVKQAVAQLSPGYFALVMGTGIISVGLKDLGFDSFSGVLLTIALVAYAVLWVLFLWRAIAFRREFFADVRNPEKVFAFFTIVAATDVLAVRLFLEERPHVAMPLVFVGAGLWFVFGYVLPWQVLMARDGKSVLTHTNGTWFIWAVASQSLAIGLAQSQPFLNGSTYWVGLLAVLSWSVGVALYLAVALFVMLRIIHYGLTPEEFEPPYWVSMGALAIAVVAGVNVVGMDSTPMVDVASAIIGGTVVIFWCIAAWLIPMLLGAGVWRHWIHKVPLRYVPTMWSMVFPMGMFAVASISLGQLDALPIVENIGKVSLVVAVTVWTMAMIGMLRRISWTARAAFSRAGAADREEARAPAPEGAVPREKFRSGGSD
ncbi:tellurite resistance/C4-dicarboxylate transporter family protein [Demequina aurantiaca]|uniref:tellurite resistance/C4-dicarboxylate transporter family protein n=1 Tax=Demequina aurantiaca TaxID=676200 RepID=UPI000A01868C|nr:tellurite resistance/C4-dicarboxylate transporter family protein [Demequina aurantiaca]